MKKTLSYISFLMSALLIFGCSATKYVPKDKYLLSKAQVKINDKRVLAGDAKAYLQQKPNGRVFGFIPMYLGIYNLSGRDSTKRINRFLRNLGEPPIIYDSIQTQRTAVQLKRFMENKGFYKSEVKVVEEFSRRKVRLTYEITAKEPKIIAKTFRHRDSLPYKVIGKENLAIELADSTDVRQIFIAEDKNAKLQPNVLLDVDEMRAERDRMEDVYKSKGYYKIDKNNICYYIDTTRLDNKVNLYYGLRSVDSLALRQYKVRNIIVYLDIDGTDKGNERSFSKLEYGGVHFLYKDKLAYKPEVLTRAIAIERGKLYNPEAIEETKLRLGVLQQFKYTNVNFNEVDTGGDFGVLDCIVHLATRKRQSYTVEATSTFNSGDWGFATNLKYQHKNLFHGAELFSIGLSGAYEKVRGQIDGQRYNAQEYGGSIDLVSPKFFLPFLKAKAWRARMPRTSLTLLYNYSDRPEYRRTITDLSFSYQWKHKKNITHILSPIDLGLLKVTADSTFLARLNNYYRQTSYVDHIIPALHYSFLYNNQGKSQHTTYQRLRVNVETAGNLLRGIDKLIARNQNDIDITKKKYFSYFGIRYAQYFRSDIDFTYNQYINENNALIYHIFAGAGFPYGNSNVMPFEKMYFAGGANSMRAWHPRSLGPGASKNSPPAYRTSYGEMKLEGNIEYRFNFTQSLEGALFVDTGNVWNLSELADKDIDSKFRWGSFYKQIAVGSGMGIRFNISGIILRLDAGVKIIDPYLDTNTFVPKNKGYKLQDITFNFGIGYPF